MSVHGVNILPMAIWRRIPQADSKRAKDQKPKTKKNGMEYIDMRRVSRALLSTIFLVFATQAVQAQVYSFNVSAGPMSTGDPNTTYPVNDGVTVVTALRAPNASITISTSGSVNLRTTGAAYVVNAAGLHATMPGPGAQYSSSTNLLVNGPASIDNHPTPIANNPAVVGTNPASFDFVRYGSLVYSVNGGAWNSVYNSVAYDETVAANHVITPLSFTGSLASFGMTTGSTIRFSIMDGSLTRTAAIGPGATPDFWQNNSGQFALNVSIVPELDPSSASAAAALALCLLPLLVDVKRRRRALVA